jgi:hypothetical protein
VSPSEAKDAHCSIHRCPMLDSSHVQWHRGAHLRCQTLSWVFTCSSHLFLPRGEGCQDLQEVSAAHAQWGGHLVKAF